MNPTSPGFLHTEEGDMAETRKRFFRSLVYKIVDCNAWAFLEFTESAISPIMFRSLGGGMVDTVDSKSTAMSVEVQILSRAS